MRVLFAGTPTDVVPVLKNLIHSQHDVLGVLTKRPMRHGRGLHMHRSSVHDYAHQHSLAVWHPDAKWSAESLPPALMSKAVDMLVTASYGVKIPESILALPTYGCLNLHPSLLPRWRGASPIEHTIIAGDQETGLCIMRTEKSLDTGPILMCENFSIKENMTACDLRQQLFLLGAKMLPSLLDRLTTITEQKQSGEITYAPSLQKADACLDTKKSAHVLARYVRAFDASPRAWLSLLKDEKGLFRLQVIQAEAIVDHTIVKKHQQGEVLVSKQDIRVVCQDGVLRLMRVQREGKREMDIQDFLRGFLPCRTLRVIAI